MNRRFSVPELSIFSTMVGVGMLEVSNEVIWSSLVLKRSSFALAHRYHLCQPIMSSIPIRGVYI